MLSRYYDWAGIDARRVNKDVGLIVEEIIERLTSQIGCEVEITLEISAKRPVGFGESTIRTINENSRTLKFEHYGFDETWGQKALNDHGLNLTIKARLFII